MCIFYSWINHERRFAQGLCKELSVQNLKGGKTPLGVLWFVSNRIICWDGKTTNIIWLRKGVFWKMKFGNLLTLCWEYECRKESDLIWKHKAVHKVKFYYRMRKETWKECEHTKQCWMLMFNGKWGKWGLSVVGKLFFQHLFRIKYTLLCIDKWRNPDIGGGNILCWVFMGNMERNMLLNMWAIVLGIFWLFIPNMNAEQGQIVGEFWCEFSFDVYGDVLSVY